MGTSVHPDDEGRAVLPRADRVGNRRSLYRLGGVPNPDTKGTLHEVERRQSLALPLDHRILGLVVAERPDSSLLVQRDAGVIHRYRVASEVLVASGAPRSGYVDLRGRWSRRDKREEIAAAPNLTIMPCTDSDPIWSHPSLS